MNKNLRKVLVLLLIGCTYYGLLRYDYYIEDWIYNTRMYYYELYQQDIMGTRNMSAYEHIVKLIIDNIYGISFCANLTLVLLFRTIIDWVLGFFSKLSNN